MKDEGGWRLSAAAKVVVDFLPCRGVFFTTEREETMSFGEMVKDLRIAQKKTLRQFCLEHGHDPSNWSKIERGINSPPYDEKTLARWARQLGLKPDTEQWRDFMDQAAIARGQIPRDVLTDEQLLKKLPAFFRSIRGAELTEQQLDEFIKTVKELHTPDEGSGPVPKRSGDLGSG
jgi:transcriptional regulator with XRE-family HTH domain